MVHFTPQQPASATTSQSHNTYIYSSNDCLERKEDLASVSLTSWLSALAVSTSSTPVPQYCHSIVTALSQHCHGGRCTREVYRGGVHGGGVHGGRHRWRSRGCVSGTSCAMCPTKSTCSHQHQRERYSYATEQLISNNCILHPINGGLIN